MIKPFEYQREDLNKIVVALREHDKVLYQLSTGGGKTYIFSFLSQWWVPAMQSKVVILCHRTELIDQTVASMNAIGLTCEKLTRDTKRLHHNCDVYVCMIETAYRRLQKNPTLFKNVGLVVADECHILIFDKVFGYFPGCKILGCSATPVVLKRIKFWRCKFCKTENEQPFDCCHEREADEWSKPFAMSRLYEHIVTGPPISKLIEMGKLVKEVTIKQAVEGLDDLKTDSDGNFTNESLEETFDNEGTAFNVILNYETYCKGKKTMIFNSTSKANLHLYQKFTEAGYTNVRMYDSVNKKESGNRKALLKWFDETPDGILLNVGVFTTGFDQTDVQAVILNVATASLAAFIQMVGRGVRATTKIFKDYLILIDGGGNVDRHQEFSDDTRDWVRIFMEGLGSERTKKIEPTDIDLCDNCGALYPKSAAYCEICGEKPEPVEPRGPVPVGNEILVPIKKLPPPDPKRIHEYTKRKGQDINFAFKILISQIVDLFIFYRVSKELYLRSRELGKCEKRIEQMIRPCFGYLIRQPDMQSESRRTMNNLVERTLSKLDKLYKL